MARAASNDDAAHAFQPLLPASPESKAESMENNIPASDTHPLFLPSAPEKGALGAAGKAAPMPSRRRSVRLPNPWASSLLTLAVTTIAAVLVFLVMQSFNGRQLDPKGCAMSYMRPSFVPFPDFDTEHTRLASKYSLYLYREGGIDEDSRVKGIPVLFIPGNAGSYKQVRPFAAEAAVYFHDNLSGNQEALRNGKRPLDFFTVDFNEDITAFHGQTLLDQAEYLNEAVSYILSLYTDPTRSLRNAELPDPSSVILLGHSMGGIVARTMLVTSNYQANSINTIVTLAAPHARAPASFDADIVRTYQKINDYWRDSYAQKRANNNPLSHVTLISIAGGGLDTVVPSDYSAVSSLVPPSHGFTVFTSTIPRVWTGMDHLAITWCDQLRKSVVRSLYDVADAGRSSQTRPRAERMRAFRHWLLTGLEDVAEKTLHQTEPRTLLTLDDNSTAIVTHGERLVLRQLGINGNPIAHLLPIHSSGMPGSKKFTLLTDQALVHSVGPGRLEVLFCKMFSSSGHSSAVFSTQLDLSKNASGTTRLACKSAATDAVLIPASSHASQFPFDAASPFSFLQYSTGELADYQFVAVVDGTLERTPGWVVAEFSAQADSVTHAGKGLPNLISSGIHVVMPKDRSTLNEIKISSIRSSLLAYHLSLSHQSCHGTPPLFTPLMRQYISDPYESKFFVNVTEVDVSLHGVAPYMPPTLKGMSDSSGLSLQIWSDPTCEEPMEVVVKVDILGSLGKLWMRYRTVFAAFPLLVVALVVRKQFNAYDLNGTFLSFSESMDLCIRRSIPLLFFSLTMLATSLSSSALKESSKAGYGLFHWKGNGSEAVIEFSQNDLILGSQDAFFWFLVPLFGIISIGICVILNYLTLILTSIFAIVYTRIKKLTVSATEVKSPTRPNTISIRKRTITIGLLLLLVITIIPYQFVYIVLCIVQLASCVRALSAARETNTLQALNFYNYAHSILVLMLWILPINIPVLVVWAHNLAVHWLMPFSSHHNILSITPFILLTETLTAGHMVPRLKGPLRHFTNVLFFTLALYAGVYGVTYAYLLHSIVNIVCAWLVGIYVVNGSWSLAQLRQLVGSAESAEGHDVKKRP